MLRSAPMPSLEPLDDGQVYNPHAAGLQAIHLVSQVLEEASVIAKAADESGQPWRYLAMLKNLRCGRLGFDGEDISFVTSESLDLITDNMADHASNVATSTPHKSSDLSLTNKTENSLIGQGDEEINTHIDDLNKSTSMFINHLFDMSDVERVIICDDTEIIQTNRTPTDLLTQAMTSIMDSYVNNAFDIAFGQEARVGDFVEDQSKVTEKSCFSFITEAFGGDIPNDIAFFIDENTTFIADDNNNNLEVEIEHGSPNITEIIEVPQEGTETEDENLTEVVTNAYYEKYVNATSSYYEDAYLTLNRDYEQCSDEEREPVVLDPKLMMMQEVELLTGRTSDADLSTNLDSSEKEGGRQELAAISGVSGVSRKSKSSLMSRCRSQGARLFSCLRVWWRRRKIPGKRRELRLNAPTMQGMCPLSPDARRRAASLLDQRDLYTPTATRAVAYKFNTVNETLVKNAHWKDYSFEVKQEQPAD